jgi:hypothetical protein
MSEVSEDYVKKVADEVAKSIVTQLMVTLGVDATNPLEMQKDFQHLRAWRTSMEGIRSKSILTLVTVAVSGFVAMVWMALTKQY